MKRLFTLFCTGMLVLAVAGLALADVDVKTKIDKNVCINEKINPTIDKCVYLGVKQLAPVDSSAQADVTKNDALVGNVVVEIPKVTPGNQILEEPDIVTPVTPTAELSDWVFQESTGVISVNQATGNCNNQGNAVAIAYANNNPAFLMASAHIEKEIGTSDTKLDPGLIATLVEWLRKDDRDLANLGGTNIVVGIQTPRSNEISDNAFQNAVGVIGVNQSAGNVNNQDNAVALAVGGDPTATLAEADLGMVVANSIVVEKACTKTDQIDDYAFQLARGVIGVNQSSGNCNNQGNSVAVVVTALSAGF